MGAKSDVHSPLSSSVGVACRDHYRMMSCHEDGGVGNLPLTASYFSVQADTPRTRIRM
ncbi:hypothetical protein BD310DRAFT_936662 [Dichomitus squalens]|uniref:Uncharacterized protein n=1 Tax=Dichomitus squalens TaxID=114155 RepID=A0A4Q9PJ35_9APHY|nr:hypothetical protein BD310DRAFT_936662 [Dichomitus squalens]